MSAGQISIMEMKHKAAKEQQRIMLLDLVSRLSETADQRLLELAKTDQSAVLLLLTKLLEVAVEIGVDERTLRIDVQNAVDNVPRLHGRNPEPRPVNGDGLSIMDFIESQSVRIGDAQLVRVDVVRRALWKE